MANFFTEASIKLRCINAGVQVSNRTAKLTFQEFVALNAIIAEQVGSQGACVLQNWLGGAPEGNWVDASVNSVSSFLGEGNLNAGTIQAICGGGMSVTDALAQLQAQSPFLADLVQSRGEAYQQDQQAKLPGLEQFSDKVVDGTYAKQGAQAAADAAKAVINQVAKPFEFLSWITDPLHLALIAGGLFVVGVVLLREVGKFTKENPEIVKAGVKAMAA